MTHATVITRHDPYRHCSHQQLQLPDGTHTTMPVGLVANDGDVVAVLTASELEFVEAYRGFVKGNHDRSHSQGSQEGTTKATDGASRRSDPPRTDGPC